VVVLQDWNLQNSLRTSFLVIVVDRNNQHFFPPLLYQGFTAFTEPSGISYPYTRMFQANENIRFHMCRIASVVWKINIIEAGKISSCTLQ
jgi:NADH:ubiquinone reductase (H+-translocating)